MERDEMHVTCAYDGQEALALARQNEYDLIFLDVVMPKMDGLEVCRSIREFSSAPIILLSAKGGHMDIIMGLEMGADDYITKPFNILEVKARMNAVLRRNRWIKQEKSRVVRVKNMVINFSNRHVTVDGKEAGLTLREFEILELLYQHSNRVYARKELLDLLWGNSSGRDIRTIDVHVRRIRMKIERNPEQPQFVMTKWGEGYYFQQ